MLAQTTSAPAPIDLGQPDADAAATADWTPDERERWYFLRGRELQARGLTAEALALFEQGIALACGGWEIEVARLHALHRLRRITDEEL